MRTTFALNDKLLDEAKALTGLKKVTCLIEEAMKALIERESTRRLANLGGSELALASIPRRQVDSV